jgi:DNA-binding NarL/FixJ family response regulator
VRVVLVSADADSATVCCAGQVGARGFVPKDQLSSQTLRHLLETH